jgi:hypothetical protein
MVQGELDVPSPLRKVLVRSRLLAQPIQTFSGEVIMTKIVFHRLLAVFALGVLAYSNQAAASGECASVYTSYQSCVSFGSCSPYSTPAEMVAAYPQCFPGGSAASQVQVSASSFQQIGAVSSSVSSRLLGGGGPTQLTSAPVRGMAAGGKSAWNAWGSVAASDTRQSYTLGGNAKKNDVEVTNSVVGIDYAIAPGMVLGVSGAFDRGAGSSQAAAAAARQASTITGYAIAPYIGYQFSKELALDASIGFGAGNISGAGNMEAEGDRLFYAGNLNYSRWVKDWQFSGKLGYLHGEEDFGLAKVNGAAQANTASKSKMDRWMLGIQAGYWLGNGVQPYAGLSYLADRLSSSQGGVNPIGKSAWQWALGLNFFSLASGVTGGIAYTQEDGRSNQKNNALSANIGMRF